MNRMDEINIHKWQDAKSLRMVIVVPIKAVIRYGKVRKIRGAIYLNVLHMQASDNLDKPRCWNIPYGGLKEETRNTYHCSMDFFDVDMNSVSIFLHEMVQASIEEIIRVWDRLHANEVKRRRDGKKLRIEIKGKKKTLLHAK